MLTARWKLGIERLLGKRRVATRLPIFSIALLGCALSLPAHVAKVAGVKFDETSQLSAGVPQLVLNGAGIRKKFFVKVYVGALYLPKKVTSPVRNAG